MNELKKYLKEKEPVISDIKVRIEMEKKATSLADKFYPDDPKGHQECIYISLITTYELIEMVY